MPAVTEIADGRRISFSEGAVEAERTFILEGYTGESDVIYNGFGSTTAQIGNALNLIEVPKIGDGHPQFRNILFCYSYDLTQLPGESQKWRSTFRYRRTPRIANQFDNNAVGTGPALVGFEEISGRVSGSFVEQYRTDPNGGEGDIGGEPVDRAGVPTSVMRQQMEITLGRTMTGEAFEIGDFVEYAGTLTKFQLFGMAAGSLVYRGANIQRIETNKFTVQHTWLYDSESHLIQTPEYTSAGTPKLGEQGSEYEGKAYPVLYKQPYREGDSHLLAPGF